MTTKTTSGARNGAGRKPTPRNPATLAWKAQWSARGRNRQPARQ